MCEGLSTKYDAWKSVRTTRSVQKWQRKQSTVTHCVWPSATQWGHDEEITIDAEEITEIILFSHIINLPKKFTHGNSHVGRTNRKVAGASSRRAYGWSHLGHSLCMGMSSGNSFASKLNMLAPMSEVQEQLWRYMCENFVSRRNVHF